MLSSDTQDEDDSREKVTISTCHAAKGLEWPVVMIPAVENGTFPFYRTDDVEEERRLLYVACTRAQGLLYLSHSSKRKVAGETKTKELSDFISVVTKANQNLFTYRLPEFSDIDRALIAKVLGRLTPPNAEVVKRLAELNKTTRYHAQESNVASFQTPLSTIQNAPHPPSNLGAVKPLSPSPSLFVSVNPGSSSLHPTPWPRTPQSVQNAIRIPRQPQKIPFSNTLVTAECERGTPILNAQGGQPQILAGKRRLGMGRGTMGYPNKKFKAPT